jgi:GTP-binding protein EngB required for normal cell division
MTLTIRSIKQVDELVAEQLGWQKTDVGYFHPGYSYYQRLPKFTTNDYWNSKILDYLLTKEQCKVTYNLLPDRTEVSVNYVYEAYPFIYILHLKGQHKLGLCLAFLSYKEIEFTLDKEIYNDLNNS